jgi:hypothetical protein
MSIRLFFNPFPFFPENPASVEQHVADARVQAKLFGANDFQLRISSHKIINIKYK